MAFHGNIDSVWTHFCGDTFLWCGDKGQGQGSPSALWETWFGSALWETWVGSALWETWVGSALWEWFHTAWPAFD